jgi:hypothetical protein
LIVSGLVGSLIVTGPLTVPPLSASTRAQAASLRP